MNSFPIEVIELLRDLFSSFPFISHDFGLIAKVQRNCHFWGLDKSLKVINVKYINNIHILGKIYIPLRGRKENATIEILMYVLVNSIELRLKRELFNHKILCINSHPWIWKYWSCLTFSLITVVILALFYCPSCIYFKKNWFK